ncbi:MAG TPA: ATP phosphoribosyltransferase regulatory subunit, partial [Alphaproteobacteria bacterium]|nr:ATP phosphoribosyltransferase regulatory subunit [Alphaproteobacteria bacterium]
MSNRKLWLGLLDALGVTDTAEVLKIVDKLEKTGIKAAYISLESSIAQQTIRDKVMALAEVKSMSVSDLTERLRAFDEISSQTFQEGCQELLFVMNQLSHLPPGAVVADLSIVRGLDYYTGTVYETVFTENPGYGSICSGGRYDDLASGYINKSLPGVGMS